ncbi:MAG TPA: 30S ribosomal protein S16 [Saprospiraceae bacterium]|nr:30S ribosomal protein S16 [Saprospiraceae bacterium]
MPVKLRLSRQGRKKAPFYHIVAVDSRAPRDGKFIQKIGTYNPMTKPATIEIDRNAAYDWLTKGAQPTDTVRAILRFKGVYYKKHLMRGVKKGALTLERADELWTQWIEAKETKIAKRVEGTKAEVHAFRQKVSGEVKPAKPAVVEEVATPVIEEAAVEEVADTVVETANEVIEDVADSTEETKTESDNSST